LFVGSITIFLLRNIILVSALEKLVKTESNNKITLSIKGLQFCILEGNLKIDSLSFVFDTIASDTTKNMKLKKMSFTHISLSNLNVKQLIKNKIFEAKSFVLLHPVLSFVSTTGNTHETTNPQEIFDFFANTSENNYGILSKLDSLVVRYGQININNSKTGEKDFSASDLTIIMKDFNTLVNDSIFVYGRMFFSESIQIIIKDLYKTVKPGYEIFVDSLWWKSNNYQLGINGFKLKPGNKIPDTISKININVDKLWLNKFIINIKDSLNIINTGKVAINNGDIIFRKRNGKSINKIDDNNNKLLFKEISVDTLLLNNFKMFFEDPDKDTTLFFKNLNVYVENVYLDSAFFNDPAKHFNYTKFKLTAESFVANSLFKKFKIHNGLIDYNNKYHKIVFDQLRTTSNDSAAIVNAGRVKLKISLKKLFRKQKQKVNMVINTPAIYVNFLKLNGFNNNNENKNDEILSLLEPGKVNILNGKLSFITKNDDSISVNNFRLLSENLVYSKKDTIFKYDTLFIKASNFFFNKKNKFNLRTGKLTLKKNDIEIRNINYIGMSGTLREFYNEQLNIKNINYNKLVLFNDFIADELLINNSTEKLFLRKKTTNNNDSLRFSLSEIINNIENNTTFKISLKHLSINNNRFYLTSDSINAIKKLAFNIQLNWKNINLGYPFERPFSKIKDFELQLLDINYSVSGLKIKTDSINLNSNKKTATFNNLTLINDNNDTTFLKKWDINDVSIKYLGFYDFDYKGLLSKNNLYFNKLQLDSVSIDITQFSKQKNTKKNIKPIEFKVNATFPFNIRLDTINVNKLFLNYRIKDSLKNIQYKLKDFSLSYSPFIKIDSGNISIGSFLNHLNLKFDSLSIRDKHSGFAFSIAKGKFKQKNHSFKLQKIKLNSGISNSDKSNIIVKTKEVNVENIFSTDSLPAKVNVKRLWFSDIDFKIINNKSDSSSLPNDSLQKLAGLYKFSKIIDNINIDTILLTQLDLGVYNNDSLHKKFTVDDLKLALEGLSIFPKNALDTVPLSLKNIKAVLYDKKFISGDSLYRFEAKRLSYNYNKQSVRIDSFYVSPLFDTLEFFYKHKWQTDRVNMFVKSFELSGFDLNRWNKNSFVYFDNASVDGLQAYLYRDKNFPRDTSVIKPLIQDMLRRINQPFRIDSVSIKNSYFRYGELNKKSFKPGYVYFDNCSLNAINVTNNPKPNSGETMKISVNMRLMSQGNITANFYFPLTGQGSQFYFNAKSDRFDLSVLNPMTQNLLGITIASGRGKIEIPLITANDDLATGYLLFKYRLKLKLYNRKKAEENKNFSSPFMNFIINGLVLKNRNPNFFNKPRVGIVYFKRDKNKAIPNYIWKSTLSGVLSTMGFNNKYQRKEKKEYKRSDFMQLKEATETRKKHIKRKNHDKRKKKKT
jgi:hypothetical protein